jgi:hypothetical protein
VPRPNRCASLKNNAVNQTKNNPRRIAVLFALTCCVLGLLAGCTYMPGRATPFRPPDDVAHVRLERQDSERILVDKIWLERKEDGLFVRGYVTSRLGVIDTMGSHLIVLLRDARGNEIRSTPADFAPRQVPQRRKPMGISEYRVSLDPLPPNTATVVVTARDDHRSS